MLGDYLEAVVFRDVYGFDHRVIDDFADGFAVLGRFTLREIDAS
jgi:hypothetical protein